jgi:hypothetical protein
VYFHNKKRNCSITPGNSAWIAERAGVRRYDFVDNAQHFQVIPTKVGIQMFFFGVRLPIVIEQLPKNMQPARLAQGPRIHPATFFPARAHPEG